MGLLMDIAVNGGYGVMGLMNIAVNGVYWWAKLLIGVMGLLMNIAINGVKGLLMGLADNGDMVLMDLDILWGLC